jgi:hypothetical protein
VRFIVLACLTLFLTLPAFSVELLFRYRGSAKDGGTLEYIFETDEAERPKTITDARAAEIAANFMTVFCQIQVGSLETQEFRTTPVPFWLICFSDTVKGPIQGAVLCCCVAGWNGACAEGGRAVLNH